MNCKCVHCTLCISTVALAISIVALCNSHPRTLGFDYLGLLVGILALLVTALIGWQIFIVINFDKLIDQKVKAMKEEIRLCIHFESGVLPVKNAMKIKPSDIPSKQYFYTVFRALKQVVQSGNRGAIQHALECLKTDILSQYSSLPPIAEDIRRGYIEMLVDASCPLADSLLPFFQKSAVVSEGGPDGQ